MLPLARLMVTHGGMNSLTECLYFGVPVAFLRHVTRVIVDSWDEVCRQDTDVERMSLEMGLQQSDTLSVGEVLAGGLGQVTDPDAVLMFNPMGMAVFDIAVAGQYYEAARQRGVGQVLA